MSFGLFLGAFLGFSATFEGAEGAAAVAYAEEEEGLEELKAELGFGAEEGQSRDQWPGFPHL